MAAPYRPSIEHLRQCFREDEGRLFWKERPRNHFESDRDQNRWNATYAGKEAGYVKINGNYHRHLVTLNGREIRRSSIIWILHQKKLPKNGLDHENRNPLDDRIDNLRPATCSQNSANRGKNSNNLSGYKGVSFDGRCSRYMARIGFNYKVISLGYFDTPKEAHEAYLDAAKKYFGEFAYGGD